MSRAKLDHFVDELEELVSDVDPQGDPGRLPPRPAGMEPPGDLAEALDEEALAGVVGLTELRVVGKVLDGICCTSSSRRSSSRAAGAGTISRRSRSSTWAMSARFRPSWRKGASAFSRANPLSISSWAGPDCGGPLRRIDGVMMLLLASGR